MAKLDIARYHRRVFVVVVMPLNERVLERYTKVKDFIESSHGKPFRHRIEKHLMLSFVNRNY
jgi:hypothetical protein